LWQQLVQETMRYIINDKTMTTRKDENNVPNVTWTDGYKKWKDMLETRVRV
jgi:hypothetical protein